MQQFYGLNVDSMGVEYTYEHAAALVSQLPIESCIARLQNPDAAIDYKTELLRSIELSLRVLRWQKTKDGQHDRNRPELVKLPSQIEAERKRVQSADFDLVRAVLGGE